MRFDTFEMPMVMEINKIQKCLLDAKRVAIALSLFACSYLANGQNYQTQGVFIYSFTRYIQWPEDRNSGDFEILVLGDTPLINELKAMAEKKKVGDRAIKVTRINSASEFKKCHILFIPADRSPQLPELLNKMADQSVLVVTEQTGMGQKGSGINFIQKDGRMAFEMNQSVLNSRKLKAAIELSRLAIII